MQHAASTNPTPAGKSHAFKSISATDTYKADRDEFEESQHIEELKESYSKSDEIVRLCQGKLCHRAPLIMHTYPDRRQQNQLTTTFTELFPQELENLIKPLLKGHKDAQIKVFSDKPISIFSPRHSTTAHTTFISAAQHKIGLSRIKIEQNINERVEFEDYTERYLSQETYKDFGKFEPFLYLEQLFKRNKLKTYETEKDKIKNIKPLQPEWIHPQVRLLSIGPKNWPYALLCIPQVSTFGAKIRQIGTALTALHAS